MSDLDAIRSELVSRIQAVTTSHGALRVQKYFQDTVSPPCAVLLEDDPFAEYHEVFEEGTKYNFLIRAFAGRAAEEQAQALLDGLRAGSGSIRAAIDASWANETSAFYATCHNAGQVQRFTVGQIEYLGCDFSVEVVAT